MDIQDIINSVQDQLVKSLTQISEFPEGLLPHMVFVEEESDTGFPVYNRYNLLSIQKDGNCILQNPSTIKQEVRHLNEINLEWLKTVHNYYLDLSDTVEPPAKKLCVFLYPSERFDSNVSDEEILNDYRFDEKRDPPVLKYETEEFAALVNEGRFLNQNMYIRFIKY